MIFQKDKRNDLQAKFKTNKTVKPYSILSLGFMKAYGKNNENRSRQIPDIRAKDKTSIKIFKGQNCNNQNASEINSSEMLTYSSLFSDKTYQANREDCHSFKHSQESIELPLLDQEISQRPAILRLDNLTNQISQQPFKKRKDSFVLGNSQNYQNEQQPSEERQQRIYVDMKKKIKKLSNGKKKHFLTDKLKDKMEQTSPNMTSLLPLDKLYHFPLANRIYSDSEVIFDGSIFRNKLIAQRIDNDVDTDDEQIASGIRRLHKSLSQATEAAVEQSKWEAERQRMFQMEFM